MPIYSYQSEGDLANEDYPANTHLCWEIGSSYNIYYVSNVDDTKLYHLNVSTRERNLIRTATKSIVSGWLDRTNSILYVVESDQDGTISYIVSIDYSASETSPSTTIEATKGSLNIRDMFLDISNEKNIMHSSIYFEQKLSTHANWNICECSSTGQYVLFGQYSGKLYLSSDYGANFSEITPAGVGNKYWKGGAMSSNGQYILVCIHNGRAYLSSDYGANFSEVQPAGAVNKAWYASGISGDGAYMLLGVGVNGRLYMSSNYGVNWSEVQPNGNQNENWYFCSMDSDGSHQVALDSNQAFLSTDYGVNWTEILTEESENWHFSSMDSDGSHIFILAGYARIFRSTNYGSSFSELNVPGNYDYRYWESARFNTDGSKFMIVSRSDGMYPDLYDQLIWIYDSGWYLYQPLGNQEAYWQVGAMSPDMSYLFLAEENGYAYVCPLNDIYVQIENIDAISYDNNVQSMGSSLDRTWETSFITVVGDNKYFLWHWSDENVELWKYDQSESTFTEMEDCGVNTDLPDSKNQQGIAYSEASNTLYFVLKDTSDSKTYLYAYDIGEDILTKGGEFNVALMLNRNCDNTNNNIPFKLERGFGVGANNKHEIYQIPSTFIGQLNKVGQIDSSKTIRAITDRRIFVDDS